MTRIEGGARTVALLLAATLVGCGGETAFGPSPVPGTPARGTTLRGVVLGSAGATAAAVSTHAAGDITVSVVEDPAITTVVGADGTFVLRGLPDGGFTLGFTQDGNTLGVLAFDSLLPNQEIEITVEVVDGGIVLVDQRRNGIGHGDVEIQGYVELIVALDPAGDSYFLIKGHSVLARPGVTAIRQGGSGLGVEDVTEGAQVHVKGVWLDPDDPASDPADDQVVLAHEIKLQQDADDEEDDDSEPGEMITICHKSKNTLTISIHAWPAHQAHGDTMGACQ